MFFALVYLVSSIWAAHSVLAYFIPFPFPRLTRFFLAVALSFPISAWLTLFSAAALRETTALSTCVVPSAIHLAVVFWAHILSEKYDLKTGKDRSLLHKIKTILQSEDFPSREVIADTFRKYLLTRAEIQFLIVTVLFSGMLAILYQHHSLSDNGISYFSGGSTWADVAIHATFINAMSHGVNSDRPFWDFESPIFSGERLVYPYLIEVQSLALLKGGFSLNQCIWIPSSLLATSMVAFLYQFGYNFSNGNPVVGFYTILLTLCAGGIGFVNVFRDAWSRGQLLPPLQHDYVLNIQENYQTFWFGFVAHIILPQRTSLSAYPLFLGTIVLLQHAVAVKRTVILKEDPTNQLPGLRQGVTVPRGVIDSNGSSTDKKTDSSLNSSPGRPTTKKELLLAESGLRARSAKNPGDISVDAATKLVAAEQQHVSLADSKDKKLKGDEEDAEDDLDDDDNDDDDVDYDEFDFIEDDGNEVIVVTPYFPPAPAPQNRTAMFVIAGVLAGLLPFCTAHVYIGLALYCVVQVFQHPRFFLDWTLMGITAGVLGAPQLLSFSMRASKWGFMQFKPVWIEAAVNVPLIKEYPEIVRALLFWPMTLGVFFVLATAGIVVLNYRQKFTYISFLSILAAGSVFQFQPWNFDNIKLLYLWYFGAASVAGILLERIRRLSPRYLSIVIVVALVVLSIAAGAASIRREFHEHHVLLDSAEREVANWVKDNTPKRALFVHAQHHNHAITNLAGRRTLVGFQGWLWSHGFDYYPRLPEFDAIWHGRDGWKDAVKKYKVEYVVTGPYWSEPKANTDYMDVEFHRVYNNQYYNVYKIPDHFH